MTEKPALDFLKFSQEVISQANGSPLPKPYKTKSKRQEIPEKSGKRRKRSSTNEITSKYFSKKRRSSSISVPHRFMNLSWPDFAVNVPWEIWEAIFREGTHFDFVGFKNTSRWAYNTFWDNIQSLVFPERSWKPVCTVSVISDWISSCSTKSLKRLQLVTAAHKNGFKKFKLFTFKNLHTLEVFFTRSIGYSIVEDIGNISSLRSLHLKITGEESLFSHKNLFFQSSQFSDKPNLTRAKTCFTNLRNLERLKLSLAITSPVLPTLIHLSNILHLDISFNTGHLTAKDSKILRQLTQLNSLNLEGNYTFPTGNLRSLSKLTNLTELNLTYCGWHEIPDPHHKLNFDASMLLEMTKLTKLYLRGLDINLIQPLLVLHDLEYLDVSESHLHDQDLQEICRNLRNLRNLDISGCKQLTRNGIECVFELIRLERIGVKNIFWMTSEFRKRLKRSGIKMLRDGRCHPRGEHPSGLAYQLPLSKYI